MFWHRVEEDMTLTKLEGRPELGGVSWLVTQFDLGTAFCDRESGLPRYVYSDVELDGEMV